MRRFAALLVAGALTAGLPAAARPATEGPGCSWPATLDSMNLAYPDTSADYWMTHWGRLPASKLVIRGEYPDVRYFSFHAYDEAQRPVDSLADHEIAPSKGSNPFVRPSGKPGRYEVTVLFEPPPNKPAPNTIYAGQMENGAPNPAGFVIYRIYIPDDPRDRTGGVPLPEVTAVTADGNVQLPLGRCAIEPPPAGDEIDQGIAEANYPFDQGSTPVIGTEDPPLWKRFYGTDREFRDWCGQQSCYQGPKMTSGFLANQQVAYLYARLSRQFGNIVVVRLKAPSTPDTRAGDPPSLNRQLRYWSLCQNNDASQRVVACTPDAEAVLDRRGYVTFVISDPKHRPANATRAGGVVWMPWGGAYYSGILIYRHMLPAGGFREAIQNIPEGTPPPVVMKEYMPQAVYCTKDRFESAGADGCLAQLD